MSKERKNELATVEPFLLSQIRISTQLSESYFGDGLRAKENQEFAKYNFVLRQRQGQTPREKNRSKKLKDIR